jgi:hypothetical protein
MSIKNLLLNDTLPYDIKAQSLICKNIIRCENVIQNDKLIGGGISLAIYDNSGDLERATGNEDVQFNNLDVTNDIFMLQFSGNGNTACKIEPNGRLSRPTGDTIIMSGSTEDLDLNTDATFIDSSSAGGSLNLDIIGAADYQYKTILVSNYSNNVTATSASLNLKETGLNITFTGEGQTLTLLFSDDDNKWYIISSRGVTIA